MDLYKENWGEAIIKVRMGIHTGEEELQAGGDHRDFLTMSRRQRIVSAAHGGQTLLSLATQELLHNSLSNGISLRDMGARRFKDWNRPEQIYQLVIDGLPSEFHPLRTLDAFPHNLPTPTTSFIGREKEKVEVKQAIGVHRLVTLSGSGGTGITRLSLQVAEDLLDQFADGVWFVELAQLTDPSFIPQTILAAMESREQQDKTPTQALIERVRGKRSLLVLDNCEHLIEAISKLVETLLGCALDVKVMASSREALGAKGEMTWHVPSMSLPDARTSTSLEEFSRLESVRLFVERAMLAKPHFRLTKENASFLAQICSRLDGIPLAIELETARVRALSIEQIAARLDDRFHLLTGGSRTALPRQQTLRAMIDWSFNLLSEQEKQLFRRIETTRQYAREMLMMSEETRTFRNQHLDYFLNYTEMAQPELHGQRQTEWMSLLETEHDNLRAALEWSQGTRPELGLRIAEAMVDYWDTRGFLTEARRWLDAKLQKTAHLDPVPAHVDVMLGAMAFAVRRSDLEVSKKLFDNGLTLARAIEYKTGIARGLLARGIVVEYFEGNLEKAEEHYIEALGIYRQIGDRLPIGQALGPLASCALKRYDFSCAENLYRERLSLFREVKNQWEIAGHSKTLRRWRWIVESMPMPIPSRKKVCPSTTYWKINTGLQLPCVRWVLLPITNTICLKLALPAKTAQKFSANWKTAVA